MIGISQWLLVKLHTSAEREREREREIERERLGLPFYWETLNLFGWLWLLLPTTEKTEKCEEFIPRRHAGNKQIGCRNRTSVLRSNTIGQEGERKMRSGHSMAYFLHRAGGRAPSSMYGTVVWLPPTIPSLRTSPSKSRPEHPQQRTRKWNANPSYPLCIWNIGSFRRTLYCRSITCINEGFSSRLSTFSSTRQEPQETKRSNTVSIPWGIQSFDGWLLNSCAHKK